MSHLLHVLVEEVENWVGAPQLPPLLHVLVPGPIGHWGEGQGTGTEVGWYSFQLAAPQPTPSFLRVRPTFPSHELLQEVVPGAGVRVHLGHAVKVEIGDSHILCVPGHIDHLERQKTHPTPHRTITTRHSRRSSKHHTPPCKGGSLSLARRETGLEADLGGTELGFEAALMPESWLVPGTEFYTNPIFSMPLCRFGTRRAEFLPAPPPQACEHPGPAQSYCHCPSVPPEPEVEDSSPFQMRPGLGK